MNVIHLGLLLIAITSVGVAGVDVCLPTKPLNAPILQDADSRLSMSCKSGISPLSASQYTVSTQSSEAIHIDLKVWAMEDAQVERLNGLMSALLKGTYKTNYEKEVRTHSAEGRLSGFMGILGGGIGASYSDHQIQKAFEKSGLSKDDQIIVIEAFMKEAATKNSIETKVTVKNNEYDYPVTGHFGLFALECTIKTSSGEHNTRMVSNYPVFAGIKNEIILAQNPINLSGPSCGDPLLRMYEDSEFPKLDELENALAEIDPKMMPAGLEMNHFETLADGKTFTWHNKYIEATVGVEGTCIKVKVQWIYKYKITVIDTKECAPHAKVCKGVSRSILKADVCAELNEHGVLLSVTFKLGFFHHSFKHQFNFPHALVPSSLEVSELEGTKCNDNSNFPTLNQQQVMCVNSAAGLRQENGERWTFIYPSKYKKLSWEAHMSWSVRQPGHAAHFTCRKQHGHAGRHIRACKGAVKTWLKGGCCGGNGWPSKADHSMAELLKAVDHCLPQCNRLTCGPM